MKRTVAVGLIRKGADGRVTRIVRTPAGAPGTSRREPR